MLDLFIETERTFFCTMTYVVHNLSKESNNVQCYHKTNYIPANDRWYYHNRYIYADEWMNEWIDVSMDKLIDR